MCDKPFIGIDLGTTYSCVGTYRNGKVEIITNEFGNRTTPSYVAFDENERYIGETAKNQLTTNISNTIYDSKRFIGRKYNDETVQNDLTHYSFRVVKGDNNKPEIEVEYMNETKRFKPEEISSMVLYQLKDYAESYLGVKVTDAVITVPAYFNDAQRQATKDAGLIAGLNVLRIINEPTAAAIAYNINSKKELRDRNVLVYDLGGGTLDVTILVTSDKVLDVKSTAGDTHLGGEDFDNNLVNYCLIEFAKKTFKPKTMLTMDETKLILKQCNISMINELYKFSIEQLDNIINMIDDAKIKKYMSEIKYGKEIIIDISNNSKLNGKIKKQCENAKKGLSTNDSQNIIVESFYFDKNGKVYDLKINITRDIFERICQKEFERCMEPVDKALNDACLSEDKIDNVVLIGGSTRIPKIKQMLTDRFGANKLRTDINPDEAVAYGATIQAAIILGVQDNNIKDLVLADITPLTVGIETAGGIMSTLIKRNTSIPVSIEKIYSTYVDNQPAVTIKVFEGERVLTKDNNCLGEFELEGIPPMKKGEPRIKVIFNINENGIMTVSATEEKSNTSNNITIRNDKNRLTEDDIAKMIDDSEKYAKNDRDIKNSVESRISLELYIASLRNTIDNEQFRLSMGNDIYEFVCEKINEILIWLDDNQKNTKQQYDEIRKDLDDNVLDYIEKYIKK